MLCSATQHTQKSQLNPTHPLYRTLKLHSIPYSIKLTCPNSKRKCLLLLLLFSLHAQAFSPSFRRIRNSVARSCAIRLANHKHTLDHRYHEPLVVFPNPSATPPTPFPMPEIVSPRMFVVPATPLPTVSVAAPRVLPG